jgi:hypothetical protein
MIGLLCFVLAALASPFKSKIRLEAENAALRHQLIVLRRKLRVRVKLANSDRWFFIQLYRWFPSILKVLTVIRPETLVRWHRAGFRSYWRRKSRSLGGRPQIEPELRALIRQMSMENPLWGAPRIHGELLKLGFEVAQSSVAKYMVKRWGPPSQGWLTFLRNHAPDIAAMDLFVVPTIGFDLLYAFVIVRLDRRHLVWINVTANPTAEWVARQITEAFPWDEAPQYLIRDRDRIYGTIVTRRLRAMGIRDKPTASASPWQNGFAERLIGSIRRECVDHIIVLGEAHLRRILKSYADYYNRASEHPSGYVIDEKRFCWLGCDPAGYFGFCRARSVMDRAANVVRAARAKIQGPSDRGWMDSISPASAASRSVLGAIFRIGAALLRLSQGSIPSSAGLNTGMW